MKILRVFEGIWCVEFSWLRVLLLLPFLPSNFKVPNFTFLSLSLSPSRKRHPIYHVDYDLSFWAGPN